MWDTGQLIVAHGLAFQERGMRIERVINNNVISALDDQGREIVAMGRGIGFQKKSGQEIKAAQVEKIFIWEVRIYRHGFRSCLPICQWNACRFQMRLFPMRRVIFPCSSTKTFILR